MRRVFVSEQFESRQAVRDCIGEFEGYRLIGELGRGAGSVVYEAQDTFDGALYALKVVRSADEQSERFVAQAINEHELSQRVSHALVRASRRLIRLSDGKGVALAMELVEGVTLAERRPRGRRLTLSVFKAVARGLGAIHKAGLVHADIKPINLLLTRQGGLKIIDMGQSCAIGTVKTRIQGTPDYIAPEQVNRGPITAATDAYNLGATMYWCVTDRHAPRMLRVKGQPAPDEDTELRDPREHNPDTPGALASLILECLHVDPRRRPRNTEEIEARLDMAMFQIENAARRGAEAPQP